MVEMHTLDSAGGAARHGIVAWSGLGENEYEAFIRNKILAHMAQGRFVEKKHCP